MKNDHADELEAALQLPVATTCAFGLKFCCRYKQATVRWLVGLSLSQHQLCAFLCQLVLDRLCRQQKYCLSGQIISKGLIKAIAHAKDGDCFVCIIIPLRKRCHLTAFAPMTSGKSCTRSIMSAKHTVQFRHLAKMQKVSQLNHASAEVKSVYLHL